QWFNDATDANMFAIAALVRAATGFEFDGGIDYYIQYDRELSPLELQQIGQRGYGPEGPRWLPDR
ncbi:unnamed protein product, partial [marine sediment metagenome]